MVHLVILTPLQGPSMRTSGEQHSRKMMTKRSIFCFRARTGRAYFIECGFPHLEELPVLQAQFQMRLALPGVLLPSCSISRVKKALAVTVVGMRCPVLGII